MINYIIQNFFKRDNSIFRWRIYAEKQDLNKLFVVIVTLTCGVPTTTETYFEVNLSAPNIKEQMQQIITETKNFDHAKYVTKYPDKNIISVVKRLGYKKITDSFYMITILWSYRENGFILYPWIARDDGRSYTSPKSAKLNAVKLGGELVNIDIVTLINALREMFENIDRYEKERGNK